MTVPTVAVVEGVKIQFYANEHPPPHFHAVFAEYRAVFDIRTMRFVMGDLPSGKRQKIVDWAHQHKAALDQAWAAVEAKQKPDKIS